MKILAVDDDKYVLELLDAILKTDGFVEHTLVNSATAALREISNATSPFDCILLDIQMPEMDGIELCGVIRALPHYKTCPILMITAMTDRSYIDRAFAAGATDYISKPFDPLELGTRIRLAEKLVKEQRIATGSARELQSLRNKVGEAFSFSIDDAVTIDEVPGAIDKLVLENYLLQLSRGKIFQSTVIAFAIRDFEKLWSSSSLSDTYMTLVDVADAIALNMKSRSYLLSYCGRGRFVCVTQRIISSALDDLAQRIQASVDEFEAADHDKIQVIMGEPVTMSLLASRNPLQLIDDAIASADQNGRAAQPTSTKPSIWDRINGLFTLR
ncbi:hypothetical protein GCM10016455_09240 [Aliiroseovarius zhejiangensis]|uniref:Response regulatory domain-containing protein n=1 Tax=Aliiroseovarius zhejiangensis TaxID=1632025 RepID=A0ABQ3IRM7_9RHOB|nr:response regulator [Aliiroseovarius zhejiangensis]GHE91519.1 hypothetical protein GCM10016455_09240 [Aliiroseovarius zhejiangensis]